jgi:hypothetical protein
MSTVPCPFGEKKVQGERLAKVWFEHLWRPPPAILTQEGSPAVALLRINPIFAHAYAIEFITL